MYYSAVGHYDIRYVDVSIFHDTESRLPLEAGNTFTIARLTACVLTPTNARGGRLLLVFWHVPAIERLTVRQAIFQRLVLFLERLKQREGCQAVVVGGDFNMKASDAWDALRDWRMFVDGVEWADYTTTVNRQVTPKWGGYTYIIDRQGLPRRVNYTTIDEKGSRNIDR